MRRREERKRGATTLQTTGHDNRAVARYNQMRGGRDQQTNLLDQNATKEQPRGRAGEGEDPANKRAKPPKHNSTRKHKTSKTRTDPGRGKSRHVTQSKQNQTRKRTPNQNIFLWPAPCAFRRAPLETYSSTTSRSRPRTRGESIRG